jgi:hypothetical protein
VLENWRSMENSMCWEKSKIYGAYGHDIHDPDSYWIFHINLFHQGYKHVPCCFHSWGTVQVTFIPLPSWRWSRFMVNVSCPRCKHLMALLM